MAAREMAAEDAAAKVRPAGGGTGLPAPAVPLWTAWAVARKGGGAAWGGGRPLRRRPVRPAEPGCARRVELGR